MTDVGRSVIFRSKVSVARNRLQSFERADVDAIRLTWVLHCGNSVDFYHRKCTRLFTMFMFIHLMTCRHFWQCLCPSISWLADTFDSVCVHPSYDLQTFLSVFTSIHLMTCRHFLRWALLSLDNTTFSFLQIVSRVQFDTDTIILYFRHHDKDTLSTCGT